MSKLLLATLVGLLSLQVYAEGTITSLKIDSEIVYFSTSQGKTGTPPICMAAENADKWTISLNTASGKATYALLVAAVTQNRNISVVSGNDCADQTGFERAQSIALALPAAQQGGYKPTFEIVAYGHQQNYRGYVSCGIQLNSNAPDGSAYLIQSNTNYCQCTNGSQLVYVSRTDYGQNLHCVLKLAQ
jgi:hypothetical protein